MATLGALRATESATNYVGANAGKMVTAALTTVQLVRVICATRAKFRASAPLHKVTISLIKYFVDVNLSRGGMEKKRNVHKLFSQ